MTDKADHQRPAPVWALLAFLLTLALLMTGLEPTRTVDPSRPADPFPVQLPELPRCGE